MKDQENLLNENMLVPFFCFLELVPSVYRPFWPLWGSPRFLTNRSDHENHWRPDTNESILNVEEYPKT
jgi:hypothetical protein